jgi:hypothetical protein
VEEPSNFVEMLLQTIPAPFTSLLTTGYYAGMTRENSIERDGKVSGYKAVRPIPIAGKRTTNHDAGLGAIE